jgi:aryl-alcohol dehydrogenase-like predicted oxidoreductase
MTGQATMRSRQIAGRTVSPIGLGTMLMTLPHPPPGVHEAPIEEAQAIRTIHAALDAGVRLLDTAINYCMRESEMGRNERLVAKALAAWSGDADEVVVVCKGGNRRTDEKMFVHDASPKNLRWSCETTLKALGVERLGIYMLHARDPETPLADSIGALAELRAEGKIENVAVSNLGRRELAEARAIVPVVAVENRLGPGEIAALKLAKFCEGEGIAFLAYKPIMGQVGAPQLATSHPALAAIARERGVSPQRVALAWCLAQAGNIIPIPSARRPQTILDSVQAGGLYLTDAELAWIDADAPPPAA